MKTFLYKQHFCKLSTAPIIISDESGNVVGQIQRTFKNRLNKTVSWISVDWEISIQGNNIQSGERIHIIDNRKWIRNEWAVTCSLKNYISNFILRDKTIIRTNPRFQFNKDNQIYEISKDLFNKKTRINNSSKNLLICEMEYQSLKEPNRIKIQIYEDALSPILVASLNSLFRICY